eukprot:scaffold25810_cov38-Phaeocystis_antarctica.AAC.2
MTCELLTSIIEVACTGLRSGPPTRAKTSERTPGLAASPANVEVGFAPACSSTPATRTPSTLATATAGRPLAAISVARPRPSSTWR